MDKGEILERSRKENKNQDIYEKEVLKEGNSATVLTIFILATIFFIVQIFTGGGINYGLYALVFSGNMATFWVKWFRLRRKHELAIAALYTLFVLALSTSHIYNLVIGA
ncbi:MAG: hypothetical protein K2G28_06460 [Acetatifactor sp.]|nr:hypothetical protein [Acetatifactor sp.]MDE7352827.1 hypothetical protein [Acetatifactor sp.]